MIDLRTDIPKIKTFIEDGITSFIETHETPKVIGIYSCPNYGWVSLNFNLTKTLEDSESNCPDFEFVEFDLLEMPEWETEYENDQPKIIDSKGITISLGEYFGDEEFKSPFYNVLVEVATELTIKNETYQYFVQMLDSEMNKKI